MDKKSEFNLQSTCRKYNIAILVLCGVLIGAIVYCVLRPTAWLFVYAPLLAVAGVALVWCIVARLVLCREPEKLLQKSFTRPLKLALSIPVWLGFTVLLLLLPGTLDSAEENLALALGTLLVVGSVTLLPIVAVTIGALAIAMGVRHMKTTSKTQPRLYREGPFALALISFFFVVVALGGVAAFFFLG